MLLYGYKMHNCIKNVSDSDIETAHVGTKLSILGGDFLVSNCLTEAATLKCNEAFELIFSAARDLSESNFIGPSDRYVYFALDSFTRFLLIFNSKSLISRVN